MRRLAGVAGGVVLLLLAALLYQATTVVRTERRARLSMVAERVFDELERTLDARLEQEEQRPFLHYNNRFAVDNELGLLAPQRSPLAENPQDPVLVGYFQRAPDGRLLNPYRDPHGAPMLPEAELVGIEAELEQALHGAVVFPAQQAAPIDPSQAPPIVQQLNKGLQSRARAPVAQQANLTQLGNFQTLGDFDAATVIDPGQRAVDVQPFEVQVVRAWLVFQRELKLDGETWEQGFVVRREAFLEDLQGAALGDLHGARLRWMTEGAGPRTFTHRFRAPFQQLNVALVLAPLPGLRSTTVLWGLAGLLLLTLVGSAVLVRQWLQQSARLAQQRTDFVAAVTHELRTPLTSIRMYAEMLEQDMAPPAARLDYLATIRLEAERLGTLVESVLTFAKLERGVRTDSSLEPLGSVVDGVVRVLAPIAAERAVEFQVELGECVALLVPNETLTQILHNLLDNGLKFAGPPGVVRLTATHDGLLELRVHNTGPPLDPALLGSMFDPFVRGGTELTRRAQGTGIGLAVVRGLVQELGGTVVAHNVQEGVEITVSLAASPG